MSFTGKDDFSEEAVWVQKTRSGFRQQIFVMYHSIKTAAKAEKILTNGFDLQDGPLGIGVYVKKAKSRVDIIKLSTLEVEANNLERNQPEGDRPAFGEGVSKVGDCSVVHLEGQTSISSTEMPHGVVTLRLLVYPGWVGEITRDNVRMAEEAWHAKYGAVWVSSSCTDEEMAGLKETCCLRSPHQVHILGVSRGWNLLTENAKKLTKNQTNINNNNLNLEDNEALSKFTVRLGLAYSRMLNTTRTWFLVDLNDASGRPAWIRPGLTGLRGGGDELCWTKSWNDCLENKRTGRVLTLRDDYLTMMLYEADSPNSRLQKWRLDPDAGALVHVASKKPIIVDKAAPLRPKLGHEGSGQFDVFKLVRPPLALGDLRLIALAGVVGALYFLSLVFIIRYVSWRYFLATSVVLLLLVLSFRYCKYKGNLVKDNHGYQVY